MGAYPRPPLLIKAFLNIMLLIVKLQNICVIPGKRYFLASSTAGNSNPVFCVGSGL